MGEPVTIVGGGWAGLAAAVELAAHGMPVRVLEAARRLGGRARSIDWQGLTLDNGQHLMMGAYRQTLHLLRRLGSDHLLQRRRLRLDVPGLTLALPYLPAPLHLGVGFISARGLTLAEKAAAVRLLWHLQRRHYRLPADVSVAELLGRLRQPSRLIHRLWAPICVAALNTPIDQASAQVFCNVLRDTLAARRAASDFLFARADLDRLLPGPAARFIHARGGEVRLNCPVRTVERTPQGFRLMGPDLVARRVIIATHPARLPALLGGLPELAGVVGMVSRYRWQPILTTWLHFAAPLPLPYPMLALDGGAGPWVFDRSDLAPGLVSVVVSAEGPHLGLPAAHWQAQLLERLARRLGRLPPLRAAKTIVEKRATYACVPGLPRPDNCTPIPGLYLAGDYTAGDYPATLEGAVRSG
ncbi:MAG: hydroxysqualene dehydroxylase HpnE, partial [Burkholderiales bacterium]|nr:hydroxysqualene dehydroxylase HpnE [Burkholderiales bacterium]